MITIKQVANKLGVSTTTVSNVIHNKTGEMSAETVERVKKALRESHYVPNINARNLASNRSKIIGVAIVYNRRGRINYVKDAFYGELLGCIDEKVRENGYYLMMCSTWDTEELVQTVRSWNVDGMILASFRRDAYAELQDLQNKPHVYVDCYHEEVRKNAVNIGLDDRGGGRLVGKYLLEKGHRKIGFVCDDYEGVDYERYQGLKEALAEEGVFLGSESFMEMKVAEYGVEACCEWVYKRRSQFSALFCTSDFYAMRIMNYLRDRGVRVPEDVSIVGFDDNIYSQMARPAITTVRQDPSEKARLAVEYLVRQLETGQAQPEWIVLPVELVERDTVRQIAT